MPSIGFSIPSLLLVTLFALLPLQANASQRLMNLRDNLWVIIVNKLRQKPDIGFEELVKYANQQEAISVRVEFDAKQFTSNIHELTACGTYEADLPIESFDGKTLKVQSPKGVQIFSVAEAKPAVIEWDSRKFLVTGTNPPYGLDPIKHRITFLFTFPASEKISPDFKWWKEIVAHVPALGKETGAFLVVESTAKGLRFTENPGDYVHSPVHEIRGRREEFINYPFSKIFYYPNEKARIRMPQSCR